MQQPQGFATNPSLVCRLRKSLYGLKQAPRAWYAKIDSFLLSPNFFRCKLDPNVYLKLFNGSLMIIVLYVDDLLITGSSQAEIASLKGAMNQAFSMIDLGLLSQFMGLEIAQTKSGIKVHQSKYALDLLIKFRIQDSKASKTPFLSGVKLEEDDSPPMVNNTLYRQLIGCLLYLTHTRPDLCMQSVLLLDSWISPMRSIGKQQRGSLALFREQGHMGFYIRPIMNLS